MEMHTHKPLSACLRSAVVLSSIESLKQAVRDDLRLGSHPSPSHAVFSDSFSDSSQTPTRGCSVGHRNPIALNDRAGPTHMLLRRRAPWGPAPLAGEFADD